MPGTTTTKKIGYYEGVLDLYFALMTGEDTSAAAPTYGPPEVLAKSIEVTITPRYREGSLYASNSAVRREKRIDGYDVSVNVDQVVSAIRQKITGRHVDGKGVQIIKGSQEAPYLALGFAQTKDNNAKELWWLYKGKFAEGEKAAKTRGENIEYQTPTLTAQFDRRIFDDALAAIVDSDDEGVADVVRNWFTAVYEETAPTA